MPRIFARGLSHFRKRTPPPGSPPGTYEPSSESIATCLTVIHYNREKATTHNSPSIDQARMLLAEPGVKWFDVQGLGSAGLIQEIADLFKLHPLAVEDVFHTPQRPKTEPYDTRHIFIVTRMPMTDEKGALVLEQLSVFFGQDWVLTFQEDYAGDTLDPVRKRIQSGVGVIREQGGDYLAYAIVDATIDGYYPILDMLSDRLASLEEAALERPTKRTLREIHRMRSILLGLDRVLWPQREAIQNWSRADCPLVSDMVRLHLRDAQDHCSQISEVVESYREIVAGISSAWLASVGNRSGEVMKVLTIMASIFIPLNFLAALYGMNFDSMPGLHTPYGYFLLLSLMACLVLGMVVFFYRRGWLFREDDEDLFEDQSKES